MGKCGRTSVRQGEYFCGIRERLEIQSVFRLPSNGGCWGLVESADAVENRQGCQNSGCWTFTYHWAFSWTVESSEQENEECDHPQMCFAVLRYPETEACRQQGPSHLRECEEEQGTSSVGVNRPNGRPGENEVHETEPPGREEGRSDRRACLRENSRGIEGDDVDTALEENKSISWIQIQYVLTYHLLRNHDRPGSQCRTADTGNSKEFNKSSNIIVLLDKCRFHLNLRIDVVEIAGCLQFGIAESFERGIGLAIALLFDVPSRALRAEIDTDPEGHSRNEGRTQLQSPGDSTGVFHCKVGAKAEEDTESSPLE
jgi:hypothetical protein